MSCHVMSCHVMSCHVMSCHVVLGLCWVFLPKSTNCLVTWADLCSLSSSLLGLEPPRRTTSVGLWALGRPRGCSALPEVPGSAQGAWLEAGGQTSNTQLMASVENCRGLYCQPVPMLFCSRASFGTRNSPCNAFMRKISDGLR